MPLFKTARESKAPVVPPESEKPAKNDGRPGTSGTEHLLVMNTRKASDRFKQAQRAERTYRAKKRSAAAKANYADAKSHYKEGFTHLKMAARLTLAVVRASPSILSEKNQARQLKADEKKRKKAAERRKKLEAALAQERGAVDEEKKGENDDDEGETGEKSK